MIKPSDLTAGCTVRLADGTTAGPILPQLDDVDYPWEGHSAVYGRMTWTADGRCFADEASSSLDIVEIFPEEATRPTDPLVPPSPSPEAKGETSGPVRYKQVPEIVPGDYGRVRVGVQRDGNPVVALKDRDGVWNAMQPLTPDELLAAGETLIALGKAGKEMADASHNS